MVSKFFKGGLVDIWGNGLSASAVWTPAAALYGANDVLSTAQTLTWTDKNGDTYGGGIIWIIGTELLISETAKQSGESSYTLQKYNVTPPSAHADNDLWDLPPGDRTAYQGETALGTPADLGSSCYIKQTSVNEPIFVPTTGKTFAELITVGSFTATATARTVKLLAIPG